MQSAQPPCLSDFNENLDKINYLSIRGKKGGNSCDSTIKDRHILCLLQLQQSQLSLSDLGTPNNTGIFVSAQKHYSCIQFFFIIYFNLFILSSTVTTVYTSYQNWRQQSPVAILFSVMQHNFKNIYLKHLHVVHC